MAQTKTQGKQEITQIETDQCNARKSVRSNRPVYAPLDGFEKYDFNYRDSN